MNIGFLALSVAAVTSFTILVSTWATNLLALQRFFRSITFNRNKGRKEPNTPILLANKRQFNLVLEDIGDHIHALEESERRTAQWVGNIAHDLRAPISAIQGYAEIMEINPPVLTISENQEYASAIRGLGDRLQGMVLDLTEVSFLKTGEKEMEWEILSLAELTFDTLHLFKGPIEEKGLQLQRVFPQDLCMVNGNIRLIERAIQNLLFNAIQYSDRSGEIIVEIGKIEEWIELKISNVSLGVTSEELPGLFSRGERGTENGRISGNGLGLSIVKEIMQFHHGQVKVDLGRKGVITFTLSFPAWKPQ